MKLKEYKLLVEKKYGPIKLPSDTGEVEDVLSVLDMSLESVSIDDYHILQAMLIIENWRKEHVDNRTKNYPHLE